MTLEGSTVGGNITVGNIIFQFNPKTNTESKTSGEPEKFLIGGGFVIAKAVLSKDGTLIINASATSERIFHGVHADIQVSLFNQKGERIYISETYRIPTAGAKWDITCPPNSSLQKEVKISKDMFNNTHRIKIDVFRWEHPGIRRYSNLVKVLGEFRTWINNAISITPVRAELTTHQAAELLNVSRPYLIKLLEQGHIPYRKVGSHRRIPTQPLLEYKAKEEEKANCALDEIVSLTEKLGLYD